MAGAISWVVQLASLSPTRVPCRLLNMPMQLSLCTATHILTTLLHRLLLTSANNYSHVTVMHLQNSKLNFFSHITSTFHFLFNNCTFITWSKRTSQLNPARDCTVGNFHTHTHTSKTRGCC